MAGPRRAVERLGDAGDGHRGGETRRIHFLDGGGEQQVAAGAGEQFGVARLAAGIGLEILVRAELRGVDEDADHDAVGMQARQLHQRQVALVQRAHGRRKAHTLSRRAPGAHLGAQRLDGPDDGEGRLRHRRLRETPALMAEGPGRVNRRVDAGRPGALT